MSSPSIDDMDIMKARYEQIQKQRALIPAPLSHQEIQSIQLEQNTLRQELCKSEIEEYKRKLAQRVPGTIRQIKSIIKDLKEELDTLRCVRNTLYNGGVW